MKKKIPNVLTILRGVLTLVIIILFFTDVPYQFTIIYVLFVVAALSDYFDGTLARRWQSTSTFGVVFDPLFDKLLVLSLLLLVYPFAVVPAWIIVALFIRDIVIDALKNYILARYHTPTPAIFTAKLKTASQMLMLHFILFRLAWPAVALMPNVAFMFGVLAVIFSYESAVRYTMRFYTIANASTSAHK